MNFIVAVAENYAIGYENKLLTHLPEDLKYFKEMTLNKVVVMGRKTLESLPGAKPLKNRTNIVLTNNPNYQSEGVVIAHSIEELMEILKAYDEDDVFIAGGAQIYNTLIPRCRYGYITKIKKHFEADTFLGDIDKMPNWKLIWKSEEKQHNGVSFVWTKYENNKVK